MKFHAIIMLSNMLLNENFRVMNLKISLLELITVPRHYYALIINSA
jgi:hypothetical protein